MYIKTDTVTGDKGKKLSAARREVMPETRRVRTVIFSTTDDDDDVGVITLAQSTPHRQASKRRQGQMLKG
jgi:hypothetical protein